MRKYDSTVARIAGNILGHIKGSYSVLDPVQRAMLAKASVQMARAIVSEVQRTEPAEPTWPLVATQRTKDPQILPCECPECKVVPETATGCSVCGKLNGHWVDCPKFTVNRPYDSIGTLR